jgi:tetratricopeptide (TPR) repeat protein
LDLWFANRSSPQARFLRNDDSTGHHYVAFRLRGRQCNRDAVGARVEVYLADDGSPPLLKTVRAGEGYLGQSSLRLHFGLGTADRITRMVVRWPDGTRQQWNDVPIDHAYELVQGKDDLVMQNPRSSLAVLQPAELPPVPASDLMQSLLSGPLALPPLAFQNWDGSEESLAASGRPQLLILWASWCQPCLKELQEVGAQLDRLNKAGVRVSALSVDRVTTDVPVGSAELQQLLQQIGFRAPTGLATVDLLDKLQIVHNQLFDSHRPLPLPCSFLIDSSGRLAAIYKGPASIENVLRHTASLSTDTDDLRRRAVPLAGRWLGPVAQPRPTALAWALLDQDKLADVMQYTLDHQSALQNDDNFAPLLVHLGNRLLESGQVERAMDQYQAALAADSRLAEAHLNLAVANVKQRRLSAAEQSLRQAILLDPDYAQARFQLGALLLQTRRVREAIDHLRRATELRPNNREYRVALATAAVNLGDLPLAAQQLEIAVAADGRHAEAWAQLGSIRLRQDMQSDAIRCFHRAVELRPQWPLALDSLAWLLATARDPALRNPTEAVELAERACKVENPAQARRLDTLAAAYASAGRFDDAVRTAQQAERLARQTQQPRLADGIGQRLRSYRAGRPLVP